MRRIFVDAVFFIALLDDRDDLHDLAVLSLEELLRDPQIELYTSDAVLGEVLTHFSRYTKMDRALAVETVRRVRGQQYFACVHVSDDIFERALRHYEARVDKSYSFVDCCSMVICDEYGIREVLTHDHDFVQEGLRILL